MYGILLEAMQDVLMARFGEETWREIHSASGINQNIFSTHDVYSETLIPRIVNATTEVTGLPISEVMDMCGVAFVNYMARYGYGTILRVLGRHMRDFLNGLDNLHEYLRLSYPKMRPPSFFCENETPDGLTLHYRSKRKGYVYYVMGQIKQVGLSFYDTTVEIEIMKEEDKGGLTHVIMQLFFDNKGYGQRKAKERQVIPTSLPMKPGILLKVFPFHVIFGRNMIVKSIGSGLREITKDVIGKRINHCFQMNRPPIVFTFDTVMLHSNNIFEVSAIGDVIAKKLSEASTRRNDEGEEIDDVKPQSHIVLKGQMRYMEAWDSFLFIATPIMENLDKMADMGLYINDLSMHDVSRDMVLVGTQQSKELKSALNQEKQKSKKLQDLMGQLDTEIKRTDSLLYQMIPPEVASMLRSGDNSVENTCQVFDQVSVLFSDMIQFDDICECITPIQVVSMLNSMFGTFDRISEMHNKVYKVETVGSTYMVVSGAPTASTNHAVYLVEMAMAMLEGIKQVKDPSNKDKHIKVKIGIHSGPIVAGIVGLQMPRYCLFGDTVNTSSRMMSNSQAMKILITSKTKDLLSPHPYTVEERGDIEVKGKGKMPTFWMTGRTTSGPYKPPDSPKIQSRLPIMSSNGPRRDPDHRPVSQASYAPVLNGVNGGSGMMGKSSANVNGSGKVQKGSHITLLDVEGGGGGDMMVGSKNGSLSGGVIVVGGNNGSMAGGDMDKKALEEGQQCYSSKTCTIL